MIKRKNCPYTIKICFFKYKYFPCYFYLTAMIYVLQENNIYLPQIIDGAIFYLHLTMTFLFYKKINGSDFEGTYSLKLNIQ